MLTGCPQIVYERGEGDVMVASDSFECCDGKYNGVVTAMGDGGKVPKSRACDDIDDEFHIVITFPKLLNESVLNVIHSFIHRYHTVAIWGQGRT